ncbi:MAG: alpha-glucosidase C-terminal domain-containing protein [Candidatus Eremiobacteraeota bacterium]|nr:alpha-glucosidase C-terminal domain-containing protein [Candidatus Eremiobacteraeota bacterium]
MERATSALLKVLEDLKRKKDTFTGTYLVPPLWAPPGGKPPEDHRPVNVNPYEYYTGHIEAILAAGREKAGSHLPYRGTKGFWICNSEVYNIFPRLATAFDHDGDGVIGGHDRDITVNSGAIRETGTFLKTLALLGHIHRLGCDVVYFLPITAIGKDGNKGDLGSPYAIRNPYELDEKLRDPLCDLDITTQFKALVEACHTLGMKAVLEFVFRTGAKDADWIATNPDWFYWIDNAIPERRPGMRPDEMKSSYGNPVFSDEDLARIKQKVTAKDFNNLPAPPADYRAMFKLAPASPAKVRKQEKGGFLGTSLDPLSGREVETRIPGAFADWPPDDVQPPWTDVTYLRLYLDEDPAKPQFNYIAYNTIRMYDNALAKMERANRPLWDRIRDIIPHYQKTFGINGVMVDMGHALPPALMQEIVAAARGNDPDFAFLSENFTVDEHSLEAGYNVVLGYAWNVEHNREGLLKLMHHVGGGMPLSFFATPESHNTPRSATKKGEVGYSKWIYVVNAFLPYGIPFIHNGYELGETYPVNTGLDFTAGEVEHFRGKPLALFDRWHFDWASPREFSSFIARVNEIRQTHKAIACCTEKGSFVLIEGGSPDVLAYRRSHGNEELFIVVNMNCDDPGEFSLGGDTPEGPVRELLHGRELHRHDGRLSGTLAPGEALVIYHRRNHS